MPLACSLNARKPLKIARKSSKSGLKTHFLTVFLSILLRFRPFSGHFHLFFPGFHGGPLMKLRAEGSIYRSGPHHNPGNVGKTAISWVRFGTGGIWDPSRARKPYKWSSEATRNVPRAHTPVRTLLQHPVWHRSGAAVVCIRVPGVCAGVHGRVTSSLRLG